MKHALATWWMLVAAYVILVAVVVVGLFVITREFDDARAERCALAKAQLELTGITIAAIAGLDPAPGAQADLDRLTQVLGEIRADLDPESGCAFPRG